jgi:hypothetical protein
MLALLGRLDMAGEQSEGLEGGTMRSMLKESKGFRTVLLYAVDLTRGLKP